LGVPKAIFDTNLFLTFLLSTNPVGSAVDRLLDAAARQEFHLLLPTGVIIELNSVAERPRMANRISHQQIQRLLQRVLNFATVLPVMEEAPPRVCRDPDDDYLIAAGVFHDANFIVTRDQDLLILGAVLNVRFVDPATFLEVLRASPE
jgi:uncharacterized protein